MTDQTDREKYAGAEWVEQMIGPLSELGRRVADLLGEWQGGIYHLDLNALKRVNWKDTWYISLTVYSPRLATYDPSDLTRLVFLCHDAAIRCEIEATGPRYFRLRFWQRQREGKLSQRHPTIEEALSRWRMTHPAATCSLIQATERTP